MLKKYTYLLKQEDGVKSSGSNSTSNTGPICAFVLKHSHSHFVHVKCFQAKLIYAFY